MYLKKNYLTAQFVEREKKNFFNNRKNHTNVNNK